MKDKHSMEIFHSAPVPKAVLQNALPAMALMLMVLVYNLADTFFIGLTHDALQVAAVSLATPVFLMFMAIGMAFGVGGTSVIARAIGEGRLEYAKKVCSFCMWSCVAVGILMSALFMIFMDQILSLIGASADTWEPTKSYLTIVALSGPFNLVGNCYANIIRAEGKPRQAMAGQMIGNILNVILDPILILGFAWNITGAAIATLIGTVVGSGYYIAFFLQGKSILSISLKKFTIHNKVCRSVLVIGIPVAFGSILMSVSQIIINSQMAKYGDLAIAGMGVAMKVVTITGLVCSGLGQGIQPLLGYCVGAKLWERFKAVLKFSFVFAFILGVVLTGICYLFVDQIVGVFLTNETAFGYSVEFTKILLSTSWFFGVFFVLRNTLQAMGAATASLIVNVSRQGIIFIPALFILQEILGMTGIVWAQPVADILSIVMAAALLSRAYNKMVGSQDSLNGKNIGS